MVLVGRSSKHEQPKNKTHFKLSLKLNCWWCFLRFCNGFGGQELEATVKKTKTNPELLFFQRWFKHHVLFQLCWLLQDLCGQGIVVQGVS